MSCREGVLSGKKAGVYLYLHVRLSRYGEGTTGDAYIGEPSRAELGVLRLSLDRSVQAQKAVRRQERRRTSGVEVRPVCYPFIREAAIMRGSEE